MDPKTYAEQQLGQIFQLAASNHILRTYKKVKPTPVPVPEKTLPLLCHYIDMAPSESKSINSIVDDSMTGSVNDDSLSSNVSLVVPSVYSPINKL